MAPPALRDDFGAEDYVAYALGVPMIFAQREGRYLGDVTGVRFDEFLARGRGGVTPLFGDWADHLTTIFTDARLKQHIELRSADAGDLEMTMALQALWKGLLYDDASLDAALRLAPRLDAGGAHALRERVARDGLAARHDGVDVLGLARDMVGLAVEGLKRVAPEEAGYLDVLVARVVEEGVCPADILLRNFEGSWHGSVERACEHLRVA
jgi:glutamate--cysteine ligase